MKNTPEVRPLRPLVRLVTTHGNTLYINPLQISFIMSTKCRQHTEVKINDVAQVITVREHVNEVRRRIRRALRALALLGFLRPPFGPFGHEFGGGFPFAGNAFPAVNPFAAIAELLGGEDEEEDEDEDGDGAETAAPETTI